MCPPSPHTIHFYKRILACSGHAGARAAALDLLAAAALHAGTLAAVRAAPGLAGRLVAGAAAALGSPHGGAAAALLGNLCIDAPLRRQVIAYSIHATL